MYSSLYLLLKIYNFYLKPALSHRVFDCECRLLPVEAMPVIECGYAIGVELACYTMNKAQVGLSQGY